MTTAQLIANLESILADEKRIIKDVIKSEEAAITGVNKERLSLRSETVDGGLTPAYTDFTINKKQIGPSTAAGYDRLNGLLSYTMNDDGIYFDSLQLKTSEETFDVISTDPKEHEIKETYDKKGDYDAEVLGFNKNNTEEMEVIRWDIVFEPLQKKVLELMKL